MERRSHNRHRHRRHHGHHDSTHKRPKISQELAHEPMVGASFTHAHGPANGPVSYIESWLETQAPAAVSDAQPAEVLEHSKDRKRTRRHHRRLSHDSSIIASAVPRHRQSRDTHHVYKLPEAPTEPQDTHNPVHSKRPRPTPSIDSGHDDHVEEERQRYEKGARHKTREDKYEQNRGGAARRKAVEDGPKSKGRKGHDKRTKKKSALATAGDLMDNFSSHAIHNDRLTAGIFSNSKAGKAPGDLTFGEMSFLKEGKPQEVPKTVPKSRPRDQKKNHKEVEDIEEFFSHRRPEPVKSKQPSRDTWEAAQQHDPRKPSSLDGRHRPRTQSPGASHGSRATTYFSWSSSSRSPVRPDRRPNARSPEPILRLPHLPPGSSPLPRENSPTPEPVRQSLIKSGIYRTLSVPEHRNPQKIKETLDKSPSGPHVADEGRRWNITDADPVSQEAIEGREHLEKHAYVTGRNLRSQLPEQPPRPPDKPRSLVSEMPGSRPVPSSRFHGDNPHYLPSDRSHSQWTVPAVPTVLSPANWRISSRLRPGAVVPLPSSFRHAESAVIPRSSLRPQSTQSFGTMPSAFNARWLLNTSPHSHDTHGTTPYRPPPPSLGPYGGRMAEVHASERATSPPRQVEQESVHGYIEDLERTVLGPDHENDPPTATSLDASHQEPYLTPFFRHGSTGGFVPAFNIGASERASWRPQSDRQSVGFENSPLGIAPGNIPRQALDLVHPGRQDRSLANAHPEGRWTAGYGDHVDNETARYWRPNTYGL